MLPEKAANAVIVLEILTRMILSALAEKIAEGGQDALPTEHANLDEQDLRRQREPSGGTAGGLMPGRGERRVPVGGEAA